MFEAGVFRLDDAIIVYAVEATSRPEILPPLHPSNNVRGPAQGQRKASRGGSWRHHVKVSRCSARSSIPPEFQYADYGFRIGL